MPSMRIRWWWPRLIFESARPPCCKPGVSGPIRANTVLLNWYDSRDPQAKHPNLARWYALLLQRAARVDQHVVVLDAEESEWQALEGIGASQRRIDVWWFESDSSRLALLFAYLMTRSDEWDEATIRLLAPAPAGSTSKVEANLRHRLDELRIDADVQVVNAEEGNAMYAESADASFVLLPLRRTHPPTLLTSHKMAPAGHHRSETRRLVSIGSDPACKGPRLARRCSRPARALVA